MKYLLLLLVGIPLSGALVTTFIPIAFERFARASALVFSLASLALALWTWSLLGALDAIAMPRIEYYPWISALGVAVHLGVDGITLLFISMTGILISLVLCVEGPANKGFYSLLLILHAGFNGAFMALNLFWFICCVMVAAGVLFFLMGIWGGQQGWGVARRFAMLTVIGQMCLAGVALYMGTKTQELTGQLGWSTETWDGVILSDSSHLWLMLLTIIGLIPMLPMLPLHTWLPEVCAFAPTRIAALMISLWPALGILGFVRFGLPFLPRATQYVQNPLLFLAVAGMLYAGLIGLVQGDLSRRLAYNGMAMANIAVLGLCTFDVGIGLQGSILLIVGSGLALASIFLMVGVIRRRLAVDRVDHLGGLAVGMPLLAGGWFCASLIVLGLPGTSGFVGLWFLLISGCTGGVVYGIGIILCLTLVGISLARTFFQVMLGKEQEPHTRIEDLNGREFTVLIIILFISVGIGLVPRLLLEYVEPAAIYAVNKTGLNSAAAERVDLQQESKTKRPK